MEISKYPKITFRLSNVLIEDIGKLAKELETNQSGAIRLSIENAVDKYLRKKDPKQKT